MVRGSWVSSCIVLMGALCWQGGATASAQQVDEQGARRVAVDEIPGRAESLVTLNSGDVVLLEPVEAQSATRAMTRLTHAGGMYQLDPMSFGNPNWSKIRVDHVTQGADDTLWAVGEDSVMYQRPNEGWQLIQLPSLNRRPCKEWSQFGVPCQMIVPVGAGRAVTIRPVMRAGSIGTEVYAVEQGELRPLGSVVLPGVALGPVVKDGEGGFWVMLRRTVQTSNFKPMRGYLHYTVDGEWKMWSDSGESVEGTELLGKATFLIDPNVRKMAPDGAGGFFALGQDRVLYHVSKDGETSKFSKDQPNCQYCQPLAIAYDEKQNVLNMLLGEWREGEGGAAEVLGPTRWLDFDVKDGALLRDEVVPLPIGEEGVTRAFFETAVIAAEQEGKWLSAPGMLMHRARSGWSLLVKPEVIEQMDALEKKRDYEAKTNPAISRMALVGQLGIIGVGIGASMWKASRTRGFATETSTSGDYTLNSAIYAPMVGALAGYYPAAYTVAYMDPAKAGESGRMFCLSTGLLGTAAGNLLGVLIMGEAAAKSQNEAVKTFAPRSVLAASGGAVVGTMSSALLTGLMYRHSDSELQPVWTGLLVSSVGASVSSLMYFFLSPSWNAPASTEDGANNDSVTTIDPALGTSFGFSF